MKRIHVAIVEDDRDFRDLLQAGIKGDPRIVVIATFPTGDRFLAELEHLDADVVVMDINMPGTSGIDCVSQAKPRKPAMQFLMSTVFENPTYIFQALCAGATGYLVKSAPAADLIAAVHDIHSGGSPMSPAIARAVVASFQGAPAPSMEEALLTAKEREVVDGLASGLMYKEIAHKLDVNISTVRTHVRSIYDKLQVHSRGDAIKRMYPGRG